MGSKMAETIIYKIYADIKVKVIMKNNRQKGDKLTTVGLIALVVFGVFSIFIAIILHENYNTHGYFFSLLSGLIMGGFGLHFFIIYCINEKFYGFKRRMLISFVVNSFLTIAPIMFIYSYPKSLSNFCIHISYLIVIILLIIITCRSTKIENGDDISLLKATNLFLVFLFTAIKLLGKDASLLYENISILKKIDSLIDFHCLLPISGLYALYELFDRKSKEKVPKEKNTTGGKL